MVKRHNERMVGSSQDLLFGHDALDLVTLDHLLLGQDLHGEKLIGLLLAHEIDFAYIAFTEHFDLTKAVRTHFDFFDLDAVARVGASEAAWASVGAVAASQSSKVGRAAGRWKLRLLVFAIGALGSTGTGEGDTTGLGRGRALSTDVSALLKVLVAEGSGGAVHANG